MGARIVVFADDEDEANAWLGIFRCLGLPIVGCPSNRTTHDGSWMVRARSAEVDEPRAS